MIIFLLLSSPGVKLSSISESKHFICDPFSSKVSRKGQVATTKSFVFTSNGADGVKCSATTFFIGFYSS